MTVDNTDAGKTDALRDEYAEELGYWMDGFAAWIEVDPTSFETYARFAMSVQNHDHLSAKQSALLQLAIAASPTYLHAENTRRQIRMSFDNGASVREVQEVLELVSGLGMHSVIEGLAYVVEEFEYSSTDEGIDQAEVRSAFEERRGYWNEFWQAVLNLDPEFMKQYTDVSSYPWEQGVLDPKTREFVYIAIDISTTHLYTTGMEQHIENAINHGATRGELVELFELVSLQGYDAIRDAMPTLVEEATKRNLL